MSSLISQTNFSFTNNIDLTLATGISSFNENSHDKVITIALENTKTVGDLYASMAQLTGIPEDHLHLEGFKKGSFEVGFGEDARIVTDELEKFNLSLFGFSGSITPDLWYSLKQNDTNTVKDLAEQYTQFKMSMSDCRDLTHCTKAYVKVCTITGSKTRIFIDKLTTVTDLMNQITKTIGLGLTNDQIRLVYKGKLLEQGYRLDDYQIQTHDSIHMVLRLKMAKPENGSVETE